MRSTRVVTWVFALLLAASAPAWAQQSRIVSPEELNAAVVNRADAVAQDRARLRALLARPEVRDVARAHGLDIERAQGAVGTLGTAELQQISPLVQGVNAHVGGGGVISMSTTTLILILLIIILIVVIA
jgi:pyruvate/2-oxoglutarate dehydrogenase complex dihydrolipoamide acyltransferase (E2) component